MINLENIHSPHDLKNLTNDNLYSLSKQIRDKIIDTVEENGGHLSSNLGVIELTLAIHKVFDSPKDRIIFDVGHQCYAHKLLTDRYKDFNSLRKHKGISGFPRYSESAHDAFEAGHASTSISAALGMVRARDLSHEKNNIIAVIGDGALTGGMAYEALNDAGNSKSRLIVILNDNEMSISHNVGAISKYLSELRTQKKYINIRDKIKEHTIAIPFVGKYFYEFAHYTKNLAKRMFIGENFFTSLGFHYLGPVNGHSIEDIEEQLIIAKNYDGPVIVHCHTTKGYGMPKAELEPDVTHGVSPKTNNALSKNNVSGGKIAVQTLLNLMEADDKIVVVTAAMASGTGTDIIKEKYPNRFFDVGITEEHAVTMCAGLAKSGYRPYFFVYSTFVQRCFDQIVNDVYLQNLPVIFCIDRCNLSGADGVTHHGIYDLGIFNSMPNFMIYSAYSKQDLISIVNYSKESNLPMAIRYSKDVVDTTKSNTPSFDQKWLRLLDGDDIAIISYGQIISTVMEACNKLNKKNINACLYNACSLEPLDYDTLSMLSNKYAHVFCIEEHIITNGFGNKLSLFKNIKNYKFNLHIIAVESSKIQHGNRDELLCDAGLDANSLCSKIMEYINN